MSKETAVNLMFWSGLATVCIGVSLWIWQLGIIVFGVGLLITAIITGLNQ